MKHPGRDSDLSSFGLLIRWLPRSIRKGSALVAASGVAG
jgi:hypothetical protein